MKFLNFQAVMIFITVFINMLQAQNVEGVVKSQQGIPIPGVAIIIRNQIVSKTDDEGVFVLPKQFNLPINFTMEHPNYQSKNQLLSESYQIFLLKGIAGIEELNPIVITAPSEIKPILIVPTNTITAETLEQQSPVMLVDAMNKIPGVFIQSGAINTNRITIRGVGSRTLYGTNKIKAYFNGIPITNGVGETVLDIYDVENLQSVEIIKGPKATLYGTNLGGTILLNSKKPQTGGLSFQNNTTIGSFGLFKNSIASGFSDKHFTIHFNYDHLEVDGFRENSQYQINSYFLNSTYRFNDKTEISLLFNHSNYLAQLPSSIGKTDYLENPSKAAFTWLKAKGYKMDKQTLGGINLKHKFSSKFENSTSVFYSYSDHYEPRPFNILDELTKGVGLRSIFTHTIDFLGRKAIWNFGTELYQDKYDWKTIENLYATNNGNGSLEGALLSNNQEKRKNINVFSDITLPLMEKLTLQFGLNYNKTNYNFKDEFNPEDVNPKASRNFDPIIAPNLNVSYQLKAQLQVFGNVSYGFNYPSLEEALTPEGIVNPEISPEKGYNYELGSEAYFFQKRWHILASYYILDIKDLLVAQRVGDDQYIGRNAGRTLHKGLEIATDYKWTLTNAFNISPYINASFNWHRFKDFVNEDMDFSGHKLTGVPNLTIASGVALNLDKFTMFINHLYVGKMPMNDANSLYRDAYSVLNLKLNYSGQLFKTLNFKLNFGVNNLADTKYASSILINATGFNNTEPRYYYPGNPRNYYGGVMLNYLF
ncbi:MAG: TonB-dependent receptor domain-containing protein [Gelidibacter sp.]